MPSLARMAIPYLDNTLAAKAARNNVEMQAQICCNATRKNDGNGPRMVLCGYHSNLQHCYL